MTAEDGEDGEDGEDAEDDERIVAYYTSSFRESDRLTATALGRLEFERTASLLRRHLPPPPARVVDVGGGTGPYAAWLVEQGYEVELFDLVPAHVAAVAEAPGIRAAVADARDLPVADHTADAVLLLGPLYHLVDRAARLAALREAARVTRHGGRIAAAAIGRYAEVGGLAVDGNLEAATVPGVENALRTGVHDVGIGFTTAYSTPSTVSPARSRTRAGPTSACSASKGRPGTPSGCSRPAPI